MIRGKNKSKYLERKNEFWRENNMKKLNENLWNILNLQNWLEFSLANSSFGYWSCIVLVNNVFNMKETEPDLVGVIDMKME